MNNFSQQLVWLPLNNSQSVIYQITQDGIIVKDIVQSCCTQKQGIYRYVEIQGRLKYKFKSFRNPFVYFYLFIIGTCPLHPGV